MTSTQEPIQIPPLVRTARGYSVLIIDDHELFSTILELALCNLELDARRSATMDARAVVETAAATPVGLVVLDLDLGRDAQQRWRSGVELVGTLREAGWQVLVVSSSTDRSQVAAAIAAGASGFVPKSASFQTLLDAVLNAAAGRPVLSEAEHRTWLELHRNEEAHRHDLAQRLVRLTRREREVLEQLAEGHRAAAVAENFVVSISTVRTQIRSILMKLEVGSQVEAVALVRGHQLMRSSPTSDSIGGSVVDRPDRHRGAGLAAS